MQRFGSASDRHRTGSGAVLVLMLYLLSGLAAAQGTGQLPVPRLNAADLPELTLASSDGLLIGKAALPDAMPPPPARTAVRVAAGRLAPADPQMAVLAPGVPAALPQVTWLSLARLPRVTPAAAPRAESPQPMPAALRASAPHARDAEQLAAAAPTGQLTPVAAALLAPRWLDPQDRADMGVLEGIFGAPLPPQVMVEQPDPTALYLAVQTELERLNCYRKKLDGDWGNGSKEALKAYYTVVGSPPSAAEDPTPALLQELKARPDGTRCPDPVRVVKSPGGGAGNKGPGPTVGAGGGRGQKSGGGGAGTTPRSENPRTPPKKNEGYFGVIPN